MQRLQIELVIGLDRHESHVLAIHCLSIHAAAGWTPRERHTRQLS
jgi:hypothetical protein